MDSCISFVGSARGGSLHNCTWLDHNLADCQLLITFNMLVLSLTMTFVILLLLLTGCQAEHGAIACCTAFATLHSKAATYLALHVVLKEAGSKLTSSWLLNTAWHATNKAPRCLQASPLCPTSNAISACTVAIEANTVRSCTARACLQVSTTQTLHALCCYHAKRVQNCKWQGTSATR